MLKRATHGHGFTRSKLLGVAVGGSSLAAMALALGAPGVAAAAPAPLAPSARATPATAPSSVTPAPVPASVGSAPVVGPLVAPAPVSSQPASPGSPMTNSVKAQGSNAQITVNPNSNLTNGQQVQVSGSGFAPSSAGGMAECNGAPNQPTEQVYGNAVPVGCTNPLQSLAATDATGSFHFTFTVKTGTIGPPASGKDSAGNDGAADAAKYPCPPTQQQVSQGITCSISYGDASGNQASANITFASPSTATQSSSSATTGTTAAGAAGGGSTATTAAGGSGGSESAPTAGATDSSGGAATAGSGGSLPFTGFGVGLWRLSLLGLLLTALGLAMVVLARRPGALSRRAVRAGVRVASFATSVPLLRVHG